VSRSGRERLVVLARIEKTHGLRGEFRARLPGGESENLGKLKSLLVRKGSGGISRFDVESSRPQKSFYLVKLRGVDTVDQARELLGGEILAAPSELARLPDGEFYWHQLVGLRVLTGDGRELGKVTRLFPTGSNDVLVVTQGRRERFIPYTDDAVARVDLENETLILTDQEGLEDL